MKRFVVAAFLTAISMVMAGCGDSEVCGGYVGGNVAVVKPCGDRTVIVGEGQSASEPNEPDTSE